MNSSDVYDGCTRKFLKCLNSVKTEREICKFLKDYPLLVRNAFNANAWNSVHIIPEFRLGSEYVVDYLILSANSGQWFATFIELENPSSKPYNKNGTPSAALAKGLKQLEEWQIWIEKNRGYLRERLADYLKDHNVPAYCSNAAKHRLAHTEIIDPRTVISEHYIVVIGRREMFDQNAQERRGISGKNNRTIASYDRLMDAAERIEEGVKEINESRASA